MMKNIDDIGGHAALLKEFGFDPPTCGFLTRDGWLPPLLELFVEFKKQDLPPHAIRQIKEKFGGLRVYLDVPTKAAETAIKRIEAKAWETRERCGAPGVLRRGGWLKVTCDEHASGRAPLPERP